MALQPLSVTGASLQYGIVFSVLSVLAALAGRRGVAGVTATRGRLLGLAFLALAVGSILL
ncbi:hypothetical protein [Halorarius halobius]|uniref:hypothetical protein n=1 Tax=Halorarius halobius TaxID=2962671 RepID=UPI0020CFB563|nr:hypothetical protein [Halorarius halobius]